MALPPSTVKRATDLSGDDFRTFDDGGVEVQGVALVGENGEHLGGPTDPLVITDQAATFDQTGATAEKQRVLLNVPGSLFEVTVVVESGTPARWLHLHDVAAPIAGGETPIDRVFVPAGEQGKKTYRMAGRPFATGIVAALSTTAGQTTLPGSDEGFFHGEFRAT